MIHTYHVTIQYLNLKLISYACAIMKKEWFINLHCIMIHIDHFISQYVILIFYAHIRKIVHEFPMYHPHFLDFSGVRFTKPISYVLLFYLFLELSKYRLPTEYQVHICLKMNPNNTCQIWTWFGVSNIWLCNNTDIHNGKKNSRRRLSDTTTGNMSSDNMGLSDTCLAQFLWGQRPKN